MSMKEGFEQQDPDLQGRQGVVRAAIGEFERFIPTNYGQAFWQEGPVAAGTVMSGVEASTLAQMAAGQSVADMAAISTQNVVQMQGAEDVRAA